MLNCRNIEENKQNNSEIDNKSLKGGEEKKLLAIKKNDDLEKFIKDKIDINKQKNVKKNENKINNSNSLLKKTFMLLLKGVTKPWELLLDLFTPNSSEGFYLMIKFIVPLILIWNLSEIELFLLKKIMSRLDLPAGFLGLTIMSWGNNAPDMFNVASAMSRGLVDLAMNAAIASEMHNILLGLGMPWLVYNLTIGKPIIFEMTNLYAFTLLFFSLFILVFIFILKMNKKKFDYKLAIFLIIVYFIFLFIIVVISFNIIIF